MKKIASFTIDHTRLEPGIYVSRRDVTPSGDTVTTFDIRMTRPNRQEALSPQALHAMEHLAATFLRNHPEWADRIVYWGPMGCCTGNYLLLSGCYEPVSYTHLIPIFSPWLRNATARQERFFIGLFLISTCMPLMKRWTDVYKRQMPPRPM